MPMQHFGRQARCIMGDEQMASKERFHMTSVGVPNKKVATLVLQTNPVGVELFYV